MAHGNCDFVFTCTEVNVSPQQLEAFNHYRKNTMSIEILKDDHLQKVNFRVKNKVTLHTLCSKFLLSLVLHLEKFLQKSLITRSQNVLREEVKEKLIWNVDRSSPSNKIRDLMKWSKDILKDIYYQRKILSNPLSTFFTKNW